jgi:acyl carrier protein
MDYRQEIRVFIVENFLYGDGQLLDDEGSLLEKGIMDSTGILELIAFLEQTFEIQVNDEEIVPDNLDSLVRIEKFLKGKINGRP